MNYCNTIFNQLVSFLPKDHFNQFVGQHKGDYYVKKLNTWNQLIILLYAQATNKDSLRDIETGLSTHVGKWYHLGVRTVARSTLSDSMSKRDYRIFEKLFYSLLERCKTITPERQFRFQNPLYSFDSTTVELCLSVFDWAKYRTTKGALKIHTLLNNRTAIPEFLTVTEGKKADISVAQVTRLNLEKGSIIAYDRGYMDFEWWKKLDEQGIYFVSRAKSNNNLFVIGQHKMPIGKGVLADELVILGDYNAMEKQKYLKALRRVRFFDEKTQKEYVFLTNNCRLASTTIAAIYKDRWQIELFFKWIKQNLKIKSFFGTSKNAVLSQIWVAMIYYLLLAYIKFQTKFKQSLLAFTRMIRESLMFRQNLIDLLSLNTKNLFKLRRLENPQLQFF